MHGEIEHEEELLKRLSKHNVTYLHPDLISLENEAGKLDFASINKLQDLADKLDNLDMVM